MQESPLIMAEKPDEIPAFKITEKKVDDSWKEEIRREREAARQREAAAKGPTEAAPKPAAKETTSHNHSHDHAHDHGDHGHDHGGHEHGHSHGEAEEEEPAPRGKRAGSPADQQSKVFLTFLAGLAQQALMQLGQVESPFTGQRELDLNGARYTIDLLAVIQQKTKGNLSADEEQALGDLISDLKMHYVQIAREVQQQMAAQMAKGGPGGKGPMRPGPGGTIPGMR